MTRGVLGLVTAWVLVGTALVGCGQGAYGLSAQQAQAALEAQARKKKAGPAGQLPAPQPVPAALYEGAEGLKGQALLMALRKIASKHKDLGYDGARDVMFADADDQDNDDVVVDCYLGQAYPRVNNRSTAYQNGQGMNAEHTWPQSKGAEGAAKADLHHLFASEIKANGVRSSFPFGVVTDKTWTGGGSALGTDAQGRTVFMPRAEHRGNVARAIFYFYTVYGGLGSTNLENFKVEEPVLLRWHQEDPVDQAEQVRNDIVQRAQGNRNPYIDRPAFVGAIGRFLAAR